MSNHAGFCRLYKLSLKTQGFTSSAKGPDTILPSGYADKAVLVRFHYMHPLGAGGNFFRDAHPEIGTTVTAHRPQVAETVHGDVDQRVVNVNVNLGRSRSEVQF